MFKFSTSIALELDEVIDPVLSSPTRNDEAEELSIPRERIAQAVRSTRLIADLERPIRIGTFNNQTAYLLTFHFSFQRLQEDNFKRIRGAVIEIIFEDASLDGINRRNPSVVKFHPDLYKGPISHGTSKSTIEGNLQVASISGGPNIGGLYSKERFLPQESKLIVHGARDGRPNRNIIRWTIEEDHILELGMPHEMRLPVIINMQEPRRFSAKVTVSAHYMFMRGTLAKMFPVIGRNDDPLFFDNAILKEIATNKTKVSADGTRIAEMAGNLNDYMLDTLEYSSFPAS